MMYYVARDGQQYGPYSADTVRQYLAAGSLDIADMAREESGQSWVPLGQFFPPVVPVIPVQPVQPQYTSGPAYNTPPYGAPGYGQPGIPAGVPQVIQQIVPPDLHWALVFLFTAFTSGIFALVWALIQANYAKKIDASSKAVIFYVLWLVGSILNFVLYIGMIMTILNNNGRVDDATTGLGGVVFLVGVVSTAFFIAGNYSIRASMLEYYNTREPIQLQLSGVMTFFFSIFYLQHHMSRIAAWKKTGYLSA